MRDSRARHENGIVDDVADGSPRWIPNEKHLYLFFFFRRQAIIIVIDTFGRYKPKTTRQEKGKVENRLSIVFFRSSFHFPDEP